MPPSHSRTCTTEALDDRAIDALLRCATVARLACTLPDGVPYVVPVSFAYDGEAFYSYTADGMKLAAMRQRPVVCVEVDDIEDASHWSSVVAWGSFEPLDGDRARDALRAISARLRTVAAADAAGDEAKRTHVDRSGRYGVVYRIRVSKVTGRRSPGMR